MNELWMKDIQERLADFEKPAPKGLLTEVQREVQRRGLTPVEGKHGRAIPMWVRGAAVAASVAVVLGVGMLLLMNDKDLVNDHDVQAIVSIPSDGEVQPQQEVLTSPSNETQTLKINNRTDLLAKQVVAQPMAPESYQDVDSEVEEAVLQEETVLQNEDSSVMDDDTWAEEQEVESKEVQTQTLPNGSNLNHPSTPNGQWPMDHTKSKKIKGSSGKRWEIGANIASVQGLSSPDYQYLVYGNSLSAKDMSYISSNAVVIGKGGVNHGQGTVVTTPDNHGHYTAATGGANEGSFDGVVIPIGTTDGANGSQTTPINDGNISTPNTGHYSSNYVYTRYLNNSLMYVNNQATMLYVNAHHRHPVRIGLSLRYHFNEKWSLQAGIDYSYHSSDLIYQIENTQIQTDQKLHFIGVPVALSYSLWSPGRFNFYLSAGGEVEKVIKGSRDVLRLAANAVDVSDREDVEEKPWQFSIMGSGGIQFNVNHLLSIYAEPGVAYYFDNKSVVPTIYQEKPFNFNLNVGLRFNIYGKR